MKKNIALLLLLLNSTILVADDYLIQSASDLYEKTVIQQPCDYIIKDASGWANINSDQYRVFCVAPNDYRSVGLIRLKSSGAMGSERRIQYYNSSIPVDVHPYKMNESEKAIIQNLTFDNASYWIVDRMTIASNRNDAITITNHSENNVINKVDLYDFRNGIYVINGSNFNTIQNCTLHDQTYIDRAAIGVHGWDNSGQNDDPQFTKIINNEIWNVNDGVQLIGGIDAGEDYKGTIIYNNDFYLTSSRYTDCNGSFLSSGNCACAENAIDIKSGSGDTNNMVLIQKNRMWGFRKSDSKCSADMDDPGTGVVMHFGVNNLKFAGNIIWDSQRLFGFQNQKQPISNVQISGNLFHTPYRYSGDLGMAFYIMNNDVLGNNMEFSGNTIINSSGEFVKAASIVYDNMSFKNNIFINSGRVDGESVNILANGNEYYDSVVPKFDIEAKNESFESSARSEFCFNIKRWSGLENKCLVYAVEKNKDSKMSAPILKIQQ